jgi:hypothetical protein
LCMAGPRLETDEFTFARPATLAAAMVLLPVLLVAYARLRGSSKAHTVLLPLVLFGAIGLFVTAYSMLDEINREFDVSQPRAFASRVLDHQVRHGRRSTSYHLVLQGWHSGATMRLHVPYELYERLRNRDPVSVVEREGYLGQPWVVAIAPGEPTDP